MLHLCGFYFVSTLIKDGLESFCGVTLYKLPPAKNTHICY